MSAEIIDIRRFTASDFDSLLKAECAAWDEGLHWDYRPSAQLIASCLAEQRLAGYALVNQKRIQGYSFFLYEGEKGMIGNLFLAPGEAPSESAGRLLEHVLETLTATPGVRRIEAQLPHFKAEDLAATFISRDFTVFGRKFMVLPLAAARAALREGWHNHRATGAARDFVLEPWSRKYDQQAAHLLYATYRGHVDAAINDQYRSAGGTARLLENIVHLRGCGEYLSEASAVSVERTSRRLAGILALTTVRRGTAHIPQVAVAPEFQGRGVGGLMLANTFDQLGKMGYTEVSLTVTEANHDAVRLYERLGFATLQTFGAYAWDGDSAGG